MENRVSRCITVTTVVDGQDGAPGKDGKGIISADIMFCLANSQSTAPADGSFTATSFADLNIKSTDANKYVWQCNKTTYTSGSPTYSGKVCLGKVSDFASVVEQYALGTASAATGTWQNNTPPSPTKGSYLWTRTKLSYTGGGETYSPSSAGICLGYYGSDGAPGSQGPEGPQGDGAAEVYVSPGSITVPCNNSGSVVAQMQQRLSLSMYVGNKVVTISSVTATCPTGVSVAAQGTSTKDVTITTSATADGMATGIVFTVVGTVDSKEYTATATVPLIGSKQGNTGPQGDQGYGIMLTLTRDNYNESQWESFTGIGNEENFNYTGDVTLRAGDYFVVKGTSTDAHLMHIATYLCTSQSATAVYGTCVSHVCDGKEGQKGDTGPMFYLCGKFPDKAPYSKDAYRCPVVYYGGEYWYLKADSATASDTPSTASSKWGKATSFDMVFTDVLFAEQFAKLGSFVVSGDWMISTKGILGNTANSTDYTKFDPSYPNTSVYATHTVNGTTWVGYNFVPYYAVDGLNGTMYATKASIKGAIEATSGRVNSLYIGEGASDSEARIYMKADETTSGSQTKTPLIYGKDSSGSVVFRLGPAVDQPGSASGAVFSGLAVGHAWMSSGGFMVEDPSVYQHYASLAAGTLLLQYATPGGTHYFAKIQMTGDGLIIESQAWPSQGQVSSGCVYKDSNGYLRVKS